MRNSWDHSCGVCHPAWLLAEAPDCARLERYDTNSYMNRIFPTVQSQHVVNLVSHHNLWSCCSVALTWGQSKTPGRAFYNGSDDGGQNRLLSGDSGIQRKHTVGASGN